MKAHKIIPKEMDLIKEEVDSWKIYFDIESQTKRKKH